MRFSRQLGPARLVAIVSGLLALYSFARVMVLFFEALSIVSAARSEDEALLDLCTSGKASGSAKMREACLKAHSERASPIVFKAIVQAVSTAFKDFSDTVGSPLKVAVLIFFIISSVTMPIIPWARLLMGQQMQDAAHGVPTNGVHFIGFAPPHDQRGFVRRKFGKAVRALKMRRRGRNGASDSEDDDDMEPGQRAIVDVTPMAGWDDVPLYGAHRKHE